MRTFCSHDFLFVTPYPLSRRVVQCQSTNIMRQSSNAQSTSKKFKKPRAKTQHKQPNSPPAERKRRTRAHVLADLSTNYVERFIIQAGHAADRVQNDYGYDLILMTFTQSGDFENGSISLQLKATDSPVEIERNTKISFQIDRADIN